MERASEESVLKTTEQAFLPKHRRLAEVIRDAVWAWEMMNPGKIVREVNYKHEAIDTDCHISAQVEELDGTIVPDTEDAPYVILRRNLEAQGLPEPKIKQALKALERELSGEFQEAEG
jgi:hypothetical protein